MPPDEWPEIIQNSSDDVIEHSLRLKADFDVVNDALITSRSKDTLLPAELEARISDGITKGIAESTSNGYCPQWSDIDKSIFSKVILKNITTDAVLEARDRIPPRQFDGLLQSYNSLYVKLSGQPSPSTSAHPSVPADAATQTIPSLDLADLPKERGSATRSLPPIKKLVTNPQEDKAEDVSKVESENESMEGIETEMGTRKDAGEGHKVGKSEDDEDGNNSSENESGKVESGEDDSNDDGSSDDGSSDKGSSDEGSSDDGSGSEVSEGSEESSDKENGEDVSHWPTVTVNLKIKQQATVNKIEAMQAPKLSDCVSASLKEFLREKRLSSRNIHISGSRLREDGNVEVVIHTESHEALPGLKSWDQYFERTLISSPGTSYKIIMHSVRTSSLKFRNRKEKSACIRRLADENRAIGGGHAAAVLISDISWANDASEWAKATLIIDFLDSKQANQALAHGLSWQQERFLPERAELKARLIRCSRCQAYGHLFVKCSASYRCGKCAEQHLTTTCKSKNLKCASCGGPHGARNNRCPVKVKARKSLEFKDEDTSRATKTAAETQGTPALSARHSSSATRAQTEASSMPSPVSLDTDSTDDEIKPEATQSLPQAKPSQASLPDTATLLKRIEDLEKLVLSRENTLHTGVLAGTKRRAGDAFGVGAQPESSPMTAKRVKKEELTREDSMGLYRQPSPFIVQRSE